MRDDSRRSVVIRWTLWILVAVCPLFSGNAARAQSTTKTDLTRVPFLVNNRKGHSAPVTSLIFAPDGKRLFSAGFDKVVHVWELGGKRDGKFETALKRTLRPPIAFDLSGSIYAMAYTPVSSEPGQSLLAVAGIGVRSSRLPGEILVLQYPGKDNGELNGRIVAQLPKLENADADVMQIANMHKGSVKALAFAPGGRYLASAGADGNVFLWDLKDLNQPRAMLVKTLFNSQRYVSALAFSPHDGGQSLYLCGMDGWLERIDVSNREAPREADWIETKRFGAGSGDARWLRALALSPDGTWLAAGEGFGGVLRFRTERLFGQPFEAWDGDRWVRHDPERLDNNPAEKAKQARGEIFSIAFSPDGKRLAVGGAAHAPKDFFDRPVAEGAVRVLDFETGARIKEFLSSELVRACQFNPIDGSLAYSGGARHSIYLRDLNGETATPLDGPGWVLRSIGFVSGERLTLGVTGEPTVDGQPGPKLTFDLLNPKIGFKPMQPAATLLPPAELPGLEVRPTVQPDVLHVVDKDGSFVNIKLDPGSDIRWYCHAVIPPDKAAGHTGWTIAVGTASGVAIYGWSDDPQAKELERKRFFAGHGGEVVALAVSPDRKWLATTSTDQTIRLWPLKDCDQRARVGLTLERDPAGKGARVTEVQPFSYADLSGLKKNDLIIDFKLYFPNENTRQARSSTLAEFLAQDKDGIPAQYPVQFVVRRREKDVESELALGGTFREAPYFSLFLGPHSSWIIWTPQGYYNADLTAAKDFLGWHLNHGERHRWEPSVFQEADKYEATFKQPEKLTALVRDGDPQVFLALETKPELIEPPTISILAPQEIDGKIVDVKEQRLGLRARLSAGQSSPITRYKILRNDIELAEFTPMLPLSKTEEIVEADVPLTPGIDNRIELVAYNGAEKPSKRILNVRSTAPVEHVPRIFVTAIGVDTFSKWHDLDIANADLDAADVWNFFRDFTDREQKKNQNDGFLFAGPKPFNSGDQEPNADRLSRAIDEFTNKLQANKIHAEDTVILWLETHLQTIDGAPVFLAADSAPNTLAPAVPAERVKELLLSLKKKAKCVILLLDVRHENTPAPKHVLQGVLGNWEKWRTDLRDGSVVVVNAVKADNTSRRGPHHGIFAEAVLNSTRGMFDPRSITLREFGERVSQSVEQESGHAQYAEVLIPEGFENNRFLRSKVSERDVAARGLRRVPKPGPP